MNNPLAQVHLLCMKLHIPAPEYTFEEPRDTRIDFVCNATLGKLKNRGSYINIDFIIIIQIIRT